jgi:hypothetical protein
LYGDALDGVEDDPAHQARIGLEVGPVAEWFTPFAVSASSIRSFGPTRPPSVHCTTFGFGWPIFCGTNTRPSSGPALTGPRLSAASARSATSSTRPAGRPPRQSRRRRRSPRREGSRRSGVLIRRCDAIRPAAPPECSRAECIRGIPRRALSRAA